MDSWSSGPQPPPSWGPPPAGYTPPQAPRLRPLTIGDVLDGMFRLFIANWRTYVLAIGVLAVPFNFLLSWAQVEALGGLGLIEQITNPAASEAALAGEPPMAAFAGLGIIGVLYGFFVTPLLNGLTCRIAAEGYDRADPKPAEVLRSTFAKFFALLGLTLLLALVVIGLLIVPIIMITAGVTMQAWPLVVLGVLLVIVALAWGVTVFSLSYAVVVIERTGPTQAMGRSFRLVRGRFWKVLGTLLLGGLIGGVIAGILSVPFQLPGSLFGEALAVVLLAIGGIVSDIISTSLTGNVQTLLYYDGRIRNEAYDLELMTREVTGGYAAGPGQPLG